MACAVVTVEEGIADEFMEKLVQKASEVKIGNGLDDGVFLGPVIREDNKKRTLGYIQKELKRVRDLSATDAKMLQMKAISSARQSLTMSQLI